MNWYHMWIIMRMSNGRRILYHYRPQGGKSYWQKILGLRIPVSTFTIKLLETKGLITSFKDAYYLTSEGRMIAVVRNAKVANFKAQLWRLGGGGV